MIHLLNIYNRNTEIINKSHFGNRIVQARLGKNHKYDTQNARKVLSIRYLKAITLRARSHLVIYLKP